MPTILGKHLDTLSLSASFVFPEHLGRIFDALKQDAQDSTDDMAMFTEGIRGVPGTAFYIKPYGNQRANYILENSHFYLGFSKRGVGPELDIQIKAECLYEYGLDAMPEMMDRLVRYFIGPELSYDLKVRRADVAVDFQQKGFKLPEDSDIVSRARYTARHSDCREAVTLTIGKADQAVQVQIYNKTLELESSGKYWMRDVWEASGLYEKLIPVWRAENRFFREGLRAFQVETLEDLIASLGDLCSYAVGVSPGVWLRFADPESRDSRSARRTSAPWWSVICAAFVSGELVTGRKRKGYDPRPAFNRCVELAGAHMAKAAALSRFGGWTLAHSPANFAKRVGAHYEHLLERKGQTWGEKVNDRTRAMKAKAWLTRPPDAPEALAVFVGA
jgi:hypothetical protein